MATANDRPGRHSLRGSLVALRILHGSMVASIGIYLVMLFMLVGRTDAPPGEPVDGATVAAAPAGNASHEPPSDVLTFVFAAVAAMSAVSMLVVRKVVMPKGVDRGRTEALAGGSGVPDELTTAARQAVARVFTASIVSWALAESVAVMGLILGMLHRDVMHYLPFGGCALVLLLALAPRRDQLEGAVRGADASA